MSAVGASILECLKECFCEDSCRGDDNDPMKFFLSHGPPKLGSCCNYIAVYPHLIRPIREHEFPFSTDQVIKPCDEPTIMVHWRVEIRRPCAPMLKQDGRLIEAPDPAEWECHGIEMMDDAWKAWCCLFDAYCAGKLTGLGKEEQVVFENMEPSGIRNGQCAGWQMIIKTSMPNCCYEPADFPVRKVPC